MRWLWRAALVLAASASSATAQSPREDEWRLCTQPRVAAQAQAIIAACTARLDSGAETPGNQAAALTNRGWAFMARGDATRGETDQTEALRLNPQLTAAHQLRAEARRRLGNHAGAIEDFDAFLRTAPEDGGALAGRGASRLAMQDHRGALADLDAALRVAPATPFAHHHRGLARAALGNLDGAQADQGEALRLFPNYAAAFLARGQVRTRLTDQAGAIEDFTAALRLVPGMADAALGRAEALVTQGELGRAIADFDQVILLRPADRAARRGRGMARTRIGDAAGAMADLSEVLRQDSNDAAALRVRAALRTAQGDRAGAIADFSALLVLVPGDAPALRMRAGLRMSQGDRAGAIADYSSLLALVPDDAEAWRQRGLARGRGGDMAGAVEDYSASLRLRPDHAPTLVDRGWARQALNQSAEAVADYSAAIRIQPDWVSHTNRGMLRAAGGDVGGANTDFLAAQRLAPDQHFAFRFRGDLAMRVLQFDIAATDYATWARLVPGEGAAWMALARARLRANQVREALAAVDDGLRAGGNRSMLLTLRAEVLLFLGNAGQALADAEAALAADASNIEGFAWRGRARRALGQGTAALDDLAYATRSAPHLAAAWVGMAKANFQYGDIDLALENIERAISLDPNGTADALVLLGDIAMLLRDVDSRVTAFSQAGRLDRRFANVASQRMRAEDLTLQATRLAIGDNPLAALPLLDEAATLSPRDPRIPTLRGEAFLFAGQNEGAVAAFRIALHIHARWFPAWDSSCALDGGRRARPPSRLCQIADRNEAEEARLAQTRGRRQWPAPRP